MPKSAYARQVETERVNRARYERARGVRNRNGVPTEKEQRYERNQRRAATKRRGAARRVDEAARDYGPVVGWYATLDEKTTPECAAAHGKNFRVDNPPAIGYPGTVHAECRCSPGPPHPRGDLIASGSQQNAPENMNDLIRRVRRAATSTARRAAERIFGRR